MDVQLRHQPSFSVARFLLAPNEPLRAESGAMMAMAADTHIEAKAQGGVAKSLKRAMLGGESFFITTLTAGPGGGWVDLAANLPGDLAVIEMDGVNPWILSKGAFLGSDTNVTIDTQFQGVKMFGGGEGAFLLHATGAGPVVVSAYGAIDRIALEAGQNVIIDTGHFVAAHANIQYTLRRAAQGSFIQSAKSGEGFVFEFTGPGEVFMQSRNPSGLVHWLSTNGLGTRA